MTRLCFGILLLICLAESADYKKCSHDEKRRELRCHGKDLGSVPANLPESLVKLEIRDDDFSGGFEFPELPNLRKLYLTNVNIGRKFRKHAFSKLTNLQDLKIEYLPGSKQNYSVTIHPKAFHKLRELTVVRLINLGFGDLPEYMFKHSKRLRHIYILGMTVNTLRSNTFAPLERVQQLTLIDNEISTAEEGAFDCVDPEHRFPRIYLTKNNLRTIPSDIDGRIEITIHNNPIVCDCSLVIPLNFNDRHAKCAGPPSLKNTFISDLKGKIHDCDCEEEDTTTGCTPPDVEHGHVYPTCRVRPGGSVHVWCDQGYRTRGSGVLVCGPDGHFEGVPVCEEREVECAHPLIENAVVTPEGPIVEGETYLVVCNQGYEIKGNEELLCLDDGKGSGVSVGVTSQDLPVCIKVDESCEVPRIENGWMTNVDEAFIAYGEEAFVICDQPDYGPDQTRVVCTGNNSWSPQIPHCSWQGPTCDLPVIANGVVSPQMDVVKPSTTLTVVCNDGYSISGSSHLECRQLGESAKYDSPLPRCEEETEPLPDPKAKKCGQRSIDHLIQHRIYGGTDAMPGEYPWNVLIEFTRGRSCGGSIISSEWVLTAGNCVLQNIYMRCDNDEGPGCRLIEPADIISITAGIINIEEEDEYKQVRTATEIVLHDFYTSQANYIDYDVALIKVNKPFVYDSRVNRVCLPKDGAGLLEGNPNLQIAGWGKTETQLTSPMLQKITAPHVSREICNAEISYNGMITETMFCAGYQKGGKDACQGDSGGPLVYVGDDGNFVQGGIISWGRGCAQENYYGVYTNLAQFYTWIMGHIGEH